MLAPSPGAGGSGVVRCATCLQGLLTWLVVDTSGQEAFSQESWGATGPLRFGDFFAKSMSSSFGLTIETFSLHCTLISTDSKSNVEWTENRRIGF